MRTERSRWRSTARRRRPRDIAAQREPRAVAINPRLAAKIAAADLIIYAPGHAALEPVSVVPDAGAERRDRREPARDQAARHQHPDGRRDHRQQRRRHHRSRGLLPEGEGPARDADAVPDHALPAQRSGRATSGDAVRAARAARVARGSAAGAHRQLRGGRHRPPRCGAGPGAVHRVDSERAAQRTRVAVLLHDGGIDQQGRADAARDGARRHRRAAGRR